MPASLGGDGALDRGSASRGGRPRRPVDERERQLGRARQSRSLDPPSAKESTLSIESTYWPERRARGASAVGPGGSRWTSSRSLPKPERGTATRGTRALTRRRVVPDDVRQRVGLPDLAGALGRQGPADLGAKLVRAERRAVGALGPPSGIGPTLLAPMLFRHGNDEQCDRFLRGMAYGGETTCQMLSEPDAGSDLAGSRTSAVRDGDEWRIAGTKVWTSNAKIVTYGMLLARTNWDVPKHRGLSFFLCPAHQPGVEARPIKQMNGRSEFNLVHFDERDRRRRRPARRRGRGLGRHPHVPRPTRRTRSTRRPTRAGRSGPVDLTMPAGELVDEMVRGRRHRRAATAASGACSHRLVAEFERTGDPHVRQDLAMLHTRRAIMGYTNLRMRVHLGARAGGPDLQGHRVGHHPCCSASSACRCRARTGTLLGDDAPSAEFQDFALSSPATSIAGGTDEIQRNHLAEKVLGLPREPGTEQDQPFNQIAHGASHVAVSDAAGDRPLDRRPRPRPDACGRRPALHAPARRARGRRDQARAARRRPDPGRRGRRRPELRRASCSSTSASG